MPREHLGFIALYVPLKHQHMNSFKDGKLGTNYNIFVLFGGVGENLSWLYSEIPQYTIYS